MVQQHNYNVLNTESHFYAHIPAALFLRMLIAKPIQTEMKLQADRRKI